LNNPISNTHPIVEEALKNFFDKSAKKEFLNKISGEYKTQKSSKDFSQKEHLGIEISTSAETRFQLDQLITFAETNLSEEKYIEFLIYLGQHTIIAGENAIAIEVHEKLLRLCNEKPEMSNISANAYLAIGEVYSRQAQWELSINYLDKAIKGFREASDVKGNKIYLEQFTVIRVT
jgi:tetratricopeptide (TPR) repeat protein